MNDNLTISTFQLFKMFPDQGAARVYLEARLWPEGARCPVCKSGDRITARAGGFYRCNACKEDFTVRTGTIMERSHVPLHKWLYAMYLLVTSRKGISSLQQKFRRCTTSRHYRSFEGLASLLAGFVLGFLDDLGYLARLASTGCAHHVRLDLRTDCMGTAEVPSRRKA